MTSARQTINVKPKGDAGRKVTPRVDAPSRKSSRKAGKARGR